MRQALRLPSVVRRKAAMPSPPLRRRAIAGTDMSVGNQTRLRRLSTAPLTQLRRTCVGDERAHRLAAKDAAIPAKDGGGSTTGAPGPTAAPGPGTGPGPAPDPATTPTAIADHSFKAEGVSVVLRKSCATTPGFTFALVEAAVRDALDKIFNGTCIEVGHRTAMQANLTKNGFEFRAANSARLQNPGACAESTGFSTPANIATLGTAALQGDCGPLGSTGPARDRPSGARFCWRAIAAVVRGLLLRPARRPDPMPRHRRLRPPQSRPGACTCPDACTSAGHSGAETHCRRAVTVRALPCLGTGGGGRRLRRTARASERRSCRLSRALVAAGRQEFAQ